MNKVFLIAIACCLARIEGTERFPFHVSIEKFGKHVCSGAIISEDVVLTTASCLYNTENVDINVRVGSDLLETSGSVKPVKKITLHKRYTTTRKDYDIALVVLEDKLTFSEYIQSIPLTESSVNPPKQGTQGYLTGFGLGSGHYTDDLQKEGVEISVPINCKNAYAPLFIYITDRIFCAELTRKHTCYGDSGSPLIINNVLVGLQSWEQKCGTSKFPGLFTNIANLRKWIKTEVDV